MKKKYNNLERAYKIYVDNMEDEGQREQEKAKMKNYLSQQKKMVDSLLSQNKSHKVKNQDRKLFFKKAFNAVKNFFFPPPPPPDPTIAVWNNIKSRHNNQRKDFVQRDTIEEFLFDQKLQTTEKVPHMYSHTRSQKNMECLNKTNSFSKVAVLDNHFKKKYCDKLIDEVAEIDVQKFFHFLPSLKAQQQSILSLKKTMYCYLCDLHKQ